MFLEDIVKKANEENHPNNIIINQISSSINFRELYIYNVSVLTHTIQRPPNFPRMFLRGCPSDKQYELVASVNDPHIEFIYDRDNRRYTNYTDGVQEVCRLMCPFNPGNRLNVKNTEDAIKIQDFSRGNVSRYEKDNFNELGLFWSFNNPPTDAEVQAAIKRLEKTYKNELAYMSQIEISAPATMEGEATYIAKAAVEYFDESRPWHNLKYKRASDVAQQVTKTPITYIDCPECGINDVPSKARKCYRCNYRFDEDNSNENNYPNLQKAREAKKAKAMS